MRVINDDCDVRHCLGKHMSRRYADDAIRGLDTDKINRRGPLTKW
jgi:hypothetical protein